MLRRTSTTRAGRYRHFDNLEVQREGRNMSGMLHPYRAWAWKQDQLWRNVSEAQWEHMRKIYRRQWFEAFRVNADEYIYKYNITKAAQYSAWEKEMEDQDKERRQAMQQAEGRAKLREKHLDILREYHERHFFQWYERASHRLQYLDKTQWVTKENIDAHIEKELSKYRSGNEGNYPLNFAGQMPLLEDTDLSVVEAPEHMQMEYSAAYPESGVGTYTPKAQSTLHERNEAFPISSRIIGGLAERKQALEKAFDDEASSTEQEKEEEEIMRENEITDQEEASEKMNLNKAANFKLTRSKNKVKISVKGAATDTKTQGKSPAAREKGGRIIDAHRPKKASTQDLIDKLVKKGGGSGLSDEDIAHRFERRTEGADLYSHSNTKEGKGHHGLGSLADALDVKLGASSTDTEKSKAGASKKKKKKQKGGSEE